MHPAPILQFCENQAVVYIGLLTGDSDVKMTFRPVTIRSSSLEDRKHVSNPRLPLISQGPGTSVPKVAGRD